MLVAIEVSLKPVAVQDLKYDAEKKQIQEDQTAVSHQERRNIQIALRYAR